MAKGIAILMVIVAHSASTFAGDPYHSMLLWFLINLTRPAVPLFVAASGYTLSLSYSHRPLPYGQFVKRRLVSLLPLYLGWSLLIPLILSFPPFNQSFLQRPWVSLFLFGQADYHLYFVPMIICLYLIFPWLYRLMNRLPWLTLMTAFLLQVCLHAYIASSPSLTWFHSDQQYYLMPLSWLFYFMFGIWLSKTQVKSRPMVIGITLVGLGLSCLDTFIQLGQGINIIPATLTTRLPVMAYATGLIVWLFQSKKPVVLLIEKLGQWSYLIFMTHTILLRIIYVILTQAASFAVLQAPVMAYFVGIALSLKLTTRRS